MPVRCRPRARPPLLRQARGQTLVEAAAGRRPAAVPALQMCAVARVQWLCGCYRRSDKFCRYRRFPGQSRFAADVRAGRGDGKWVGLPAGSQRHRPECREARPGAIGAARRPDGYGGTGRPCPGAGGGVSPDQPGGRFDSAGAGVLERARGCVGSWGERTAVGDLRGWSAEWCCVLLGA